MSRDHLQATPAAEPTHSRRGFQYSRRPTRQCPPKVRGADARQRSRGVGRNETVVNAASWRLGLTLVNVTLGSTVLFDPLPVGRIGVRLADEEVVLGTDFSTFAWMIEEFVALGATTVHVTKSAPEVRLVGQMPRLLRRRVTIIDDEPETMSTALILEPIHEELGCWIERGTLLFSKKTPPSTQRAVRQIGHGLHALAVGLNHGTQVGLSAAAFCSALETIRSQARSPEARATCSQLLGVAKAYREVAFDAPHAKALAPTSLLNLFDELVNNERYLTFSRAVARIGSVSGRRAALSRIRSTVRSLFSSPPAAARLESVTKIVSVGSGKALPKAEALFSMFSVRRMPVLVDLAQAKRLALRRWLAAGASEPLNQSGQRLSHGAVRWLPPLASASPSAPGDSLLHMGRVGELREVLAAFERSHSSRQ